MINALKVDDRQSAKMLLGLMLDLPNNSSIQKQFKKIIAKPSFNRFLKSMMEDDFLGKDIEWVLVIPLEKYTNNCNGQYELIFGRGQGISKKDLFLVWINKKRSISVLNLKHDEKRRDIMSLYELYNLATQYEAITSKVHPHKRSIKYATIENIKECLGVRLENKDIEIFNGCKNESFLLAPQHLRTELKHLNITLNILKEASLILLKDVFNERYSFHKKNKKYTLNYDTYAVTRKFLRYIGIYPERRGGVIETRERLKDSDNEEIINKLIKDCIGLAIKQPTSKQIKEAFQNQDCPIPKEWLIRRIKNQIKSGISALQTFKDYNPK
jgi:hypothetical protein